MSVMSEWLRTYQPAAVPGVTDSIGNTPEPRRTGQLASGHMLSDTPPGGDPNDPGRTDRHSWNQVTMPRPLAVVQTVYGESAPLGSSIQDHQGRAVLGLMDQAAAANPAPCSQLRSEPSASPHMHGPDHPAPSGTGERFGTTPMRPGGNACLPSAIGGQR